ncbi:MAG TPA: Tat pathway signal sequence domain protein [Stellaceae bacterium]|nr:Tat pathway signal sequence domain protein [Stellaceae bacterium]
MGFVAAVLLGTGLAFGAAAAPSSPSPIGIQLNRLDDHGGNCRASFVITNPGPEAFTGFRLDLVMFDKGGTITRRLAVDIAPLLADKTSVKIFDIPQISCAGIGSMLINDVLDCRDAKGPVADCVGRVTPTSKLPVKLMK